MKRAILFVLGALADRLGGLGLFAAVLSVAGLLWYVIKATSRFLASVFVPLLLLSAGCHRGVNHEAFLLIGGVLCALWVVVGLVRVAFRLVFLVAVVAFVAALFAGCDGGAFRVTAESHVEDAGVAAVDAGGAAADAGGAAVDTGEVADARPAVPTCGAGAIIIQETCNIPESGEWLCQVAGGGGDERPCAVPNLHRFIVADCDQCEGVLR